jgi:RNA polymerase sigma factor (sigma-70 family)
MARRFFFRLLSAAVPAGDHVPDAELLRRFTASGDSAAFELLVRRHADAVWSAALRVLRNETDADDAFQAAFLVLAKKAGSVRGACVGGWLHRVAVNAALKLRARRTPGANPGVLDQAETPGSEPGTRPELDELATVVHQELSCLPDRYRLPVVLCDLEGHTHAEAAKVLGWPVGSVSGRLSRAHSLLRDRLSRRGLAPAAVLLSACAAPVGAVHAASAVVCGSITVSPVVTSLAEGVLSAMRIAKLKLTAVVAAGLLGLAGTGTVIALAQAPAPGAPGEPATPEPGTRAPVPKLDPKPDPNFDPNFTAFPNLKSIDRLEDIAKVCPRIFSNTPVTVLTTDDTYRRLLKARIEQGRVEVQKIRELMMVGRWTPSDMWSLHQCYDDMRAAMTELWANEPNTLVPWLEEFVILAKDYERFTKARVETGTDPPQQLNTARRYRLKVEAALWKVKNSQPGAR